MKLVSCRIENFGAISKAEFDFREGLTCFSNRNGAGKTTLAAFIKAMFYGLPASRANGKKFDDRKRYYPFNGGRFGGTLVFEAGGETYRVERFFGKTGTSGDELTVYKGGKRLKDLSAGLGESVFGLDCDSFGRTVFMTAEEPQGTAGEDILNKLTGEVRADDAGYERALKALDSRKRKLKAGRGSGGLIDRKISERERLREEIKRLENMRSSAERKYAERAGLERRAEELESGFAPQAVKPATEQKSQKSGGYAAVYALIVTFAALFSAGAVLCAFLLPAGIVLAVVGAAGLAFSLFALRSKRSKNSAVEEDTSPHMGQITQIYGELKDLRRRLGALDVSIAADEAELGRLPALTAELNRLELEIENLSREYSITELAERYLLKADERLKVKYVEPVKNAFGRYADIIKPAIGGKVVLCEDFSLKFESGGVLFDERHLSAGQLSACRLCLRLALTDCIFPREKPFLILDDPFTPLDGENMAGAKRALRMLSESVQIIYFTCHESREV